MLGKIREIEVWSKKNEPGAFQVRITGGDFSKSPYKWFCGEAGKIFPASSKYFRRKLYGKICTLIRAADKSGKKESWTRLPKGAHAHQARCEAAGACE